MRASGLSLRWVLDEVVFFGDLRLLFSGDDDSCLLDCRPLPDFLDLRGDLPLLSSSASLRITEASESDSSSEEELEDEELCVLPDDLRFSGEARKFSAALAGRIAVIPVLGGWVGRFWSLSIASDILFSKIGFSMGAETCGGGWGFLIRGSLFGGT